MGTKVTLYKANIDPDPNPKYRLPVFCRQDDRTPIVVQGGPKN